MCDMVYRMAKNQDDKKTEFLSVRVSRSVKAKLEKIAVENERPLSWVVSRVLENYVNSKNAGKL